MLIPNIWIGPKEIILSQHYSISQDTPQIRSQIAFVFHNLIASFKILEEDIWDIYDALYKNNALFANFPRDWNHSLIETLFVLFKKEFLGTVKHHFTFTVVNLKSKSSPFKGIRGEIDRKNKWKE